MREVARFLGNLSVTFEAVPYGRPFYRCLKMDKSKSLSLHYET